MQGLKAIQKDFIYKTLSIAGNEGWHPKLFVSVEARNSLPKGLSKLLFPGGNIEVISAFLSDIDKAALEGYNMSSKPTGVTASFIEYFKIRFQLLSTHKAAVTKIISFFSLPWNIWYGMHIKWRTVDHIWYEIANDQSTDFNFYTKRMLLGTVYSSALLYWLSDHSEQNKDTIRFLQKELETITDYARYFKKASPA